MNFRRKTQQEYRAQSKLTLIIKVSLLIFVGFMIIINTWTGHFVDSVLAKYRCFHINPLPPKQHLAFLKIHKCASSTVQNILMRYGETHNCSFVLSCRGNYLTYYNSFNISNLYLMPEKIQPKYDILTHHTIFSKEGFAEVMYDDAAYVAILRDPVDVFESLYEFSNFQNVYKKNLTEFIKWEKKPSGEINTRVSKHVGRNQMMFILGFNASEFDNIEKVHLWIKFINESFDLIMIAERFDESLILLKNLMGWAMDDIVYLTHNARQKYYVSLLTSDEREALREYNLADQLLYDYFYDKFEKKVIEFGKERMNGELSELQSTIARYKLICGFEMRNSTNIAGVYKPWSKKVLGYRLNPKSGIICQRLAMAELQFTERLQRKQKLKCRPKSTKTQNTKNKKKENQKANVTVKSNGNSAKEKEAVKSREKNSNPNKKPVTQKGKNPTSGGKNAVTTKNEINQSHNTKTKAVVESKKSTSVSIMNKPKIQLKSTTFKKGIITTSLPLKTVTSKYNEKH